MNIPQLEGMMVLFSWRIDAENLHYWVKELICLIDILFKYDLYTVHILKLAQGNRASPSLVQ